MSLASRLDRVKTKARVEGGGHLIDAHAHTVRHRQELEASGVAGCFYCCANFSPAEIEVWVDNDDCALCPCCGIDSVIGDASGYPVADKTFLKEMHQQWFSAC